MKLKVEMADVKSDESVDNEETEDTGRISSFGLQLQPTLNTAVSTNQLIKKKKRYIFVMFSNQMKFTLFLTFQDNKRNHVKT